jgi:hypothetical protein
MYELTLQQTEGMRLGSGISTKTGSMESRPKIKTHVLPFHPMALSFQIQLSKFPL